MSASHSQSSRRRSFSEASRGKSLGGLSYPQGPRPHRPAASIIPRSAPVISITREPSAFFDQSYATRFNLPHTGQSAPFESLGFEGFVFVRSAFDQILTKAPGQGDEI